MSTDTAMDAEFDTMAHWVADAVAELGEDHALPAACRGSGSPAGLEWLARTMGVRRHATLLDVGAGTGGPAEVVARRLGATPMLAEPMPDACAAAQRMFGRPVSVADGASLPFADASFDHAWSIGVLCTVSDKATHVRELARVVPVGSTVGLLVFVAEVDELPEEPEGNYFVGLPEIETLLADAGLAVERRARLDDFDTPQDWEDRAARVEEVVEREHGDEEAWQVADRQHRQMAALIGDGFVEGHLLVCRRVQEVRSIEIDGLAIAYDARVLEPRPWTAMQGQWAGELLADADAPSGVILELCTGAGHIGLVAAVASGRELVAVDLDPVACTFARRNAAAAGVGDRTDVREGAMGAVLRDEETFAIVVADPPWVTSAEVGRFPEDPLLAIDGGDDGLEVAMECMAVAGRHLAPGGSLLLQLGTEAQMDEVVSRAGDGWHDAGRRTGARGVVLRLVRD
ncbi:methyltransferase domain-containing protein [Nocardioides sp.]|uniref:methyltransferase domain-containing protein n=1 Tax=Nocardioides sp. TaxID=35761 RepID=UPI00286D2096|nr:methyltransferase domain-containing protein [Nocardioides sp.]